MGRDHLGQTGPASRMPLGRVDGELDGQADLGAEQCARSIGFGTGLAVYRGAEDAGIGHAGDGRAGAVQRQDDPDALRLNSKLRSLTACLHAVAQCEPMSPSFTFTAAAMIDP